MIRKMNAAMQTRTKVMAGLDNSSSAILAAMGSVENSTCTKTRATKTERCFKSAPLLANHQLETGPDVVDRAHLHIHQPHRQCNVANDVFGDVRFHLRRFLGPGHPHRSGGSDHSHERRQFLCKCARAGLEDMGDIRLSACRRRDGEGRHVALDEVFVIGGRVDYANSLPRLDAELLEKRFAGVSRRHRGAQFKPSPADWHPSVWSR